MIRVLLADDHPLWRSGVHTLLAAEPDIDVVAEAGDGIEALRLLRTTDFDVAVLDMEMPGATGVEVARAVQAEKIAVHVLALSSYDEPEYVSGLLASGASGYLTKSQSPEMIVEAVRAVARGERRWFVSPTAEPTPEDIGEGLSSRQRDVLRLLAGGRSNTQIADVLSVSEDTVRNHLTALYAKLGVVSAREAVAWAWRTGFVTKPNP